MVPYQLPNTPATIFHSPPLPVAQILQASHVADTTFCRDYPYQLLKSVRWQGAVTSGVTSLKVKQEYKGRAGPSVRAREVRVGTDGALILDRAAIGYLHIDGICAVSLGDLAVKMENCRQKSWAIILELRACSHTLEEHYSNLSQAWVCSSLWPKRGVQLSLVQKTFSNRHLFLGPRRMWATFCWATRSHLSTSKYPNIP